MYLTCSAQSIDDNPLTTIQTAARQIEAQHVACAFGNPQRANLVVEAFERMTGSERFAVHELHSHINHLTNRFSCKQK